MLRQDSCRVRRAAPGLRVGQCAAARRIALLLVVRVGLTDAQQHAFLELGQRTGRQCFFLELGAVFRRFM